MIKYFALIISIFYSYNFSIEKQAEMKGIEVFQKFPTINNFGKLEKYDTLSVKIFQYKNYNIYHLSYRFDSTVNKKLLLREYRYHYLIHENGKSSGYDYDLNKSQHWREVPMDSIFKLEWIFRIPTDDFFKNYSNSLLKIENDSSKGYLKETYAWEGIKDTTMSGTCMLEFSSSIKGIDFSLSKTLDSAKKMKLIRVDFFNAARYWREGGVNIDNVETFYALKELPQSEYTEVLNILKLYEKNVSVK